ncbi:MAG: TIGR04282 family arsenosugar biosynthesis glycosyltransferase [Candidatus Cloacimonetes bacterium]|nr:TIGR04282 family arsenosugar biosynthesis glycosyltransferase [Candidatus Cloacimonadota bacterium]
MSKQLLCLFLKNPNLEAAKSRLALGIGKQKAYEIYILMVNYLINLTSSFEDVDVKFYVSKSSRDLPWNIETSLQIGNDLGEKMSNMFEKELKVYDKVCLIGTDCIYEDLSDFRRAFESLDNNRVVLQAAADGGYTLVGMSKHYPKLFAGMPYSQSNLFQKSLEYLERAEIPYFSLPVRLDIDHEEDLLLWLEARKDDSQVSHFHSKVTNALIQY